MSNYRKFCCESHNFRTDDLEEWREHEKNEEHTITGSALCNYCGIATQFSFTGKILRKMSPTICNNCKQKIELVKQGLGL